MFAGPVQLALSLLFLVAVPLLAYPLAALLPLYRKQGREGQRNLAFLLNPLGYLAAVIYGCSADVSRSLLLIYLTYFLSVAVLLIFNKVLRQRASGHACGIAGPLILLIYFIGWMCVLPCAIIFAAVTWSSLYLHRHTPGELTAGKRNGSSFFCHEPAPGFLADLKIFAECKGPQNASLVLHTHGLNGFL